MVVANPEETHPPPAKAPPVQLRARPQAMPKPMAPVLPRETTPSPRTRLPAPKAMMNENLRPAWLTRFVENNQPRATTGEAPADDLAEVLQRSREARERQDGSARAANREAWQALREKLPPHKTMILEAAKSVAMADKGLAFSINPTLVPGESQPHLRIGPPAAQDFRLNINTTLNDPDNLDPNEILGNAGNVITRALNMAKAVGNKYSFSMKEGERRRAWINDMYHKTKNLPWLENPDYDKKKDYPPGVGKWKIDTKQWTILDTALWTYTLGKDGFPAEHGPPPGIITFQNGYHVTQAVIDGRLVKSCHPEEVTPLGIRISNRSATSQRAEAIASQKQRCVSDTILDKLNSWRSVSGETMSYPNGS
jgi:hypothetical protein